MTPHLLKAFTLISISVCDVLSDSLKAEEKQDSIGGLLVIYTKYCYQYNQEKEVFCGK